MYIAAGQGQTTNPRGQNFDVNRNLLSLQSFATKVSKNLWSVNLYIFFPWFYTSCHFGHLFQVSKKSPWSLILYNFFMILYMYIAPWQEQTAPRGQSFDVNRTVLSLHSFVASFKKMSLWCLILYNFFHDLIHVYSPRAGADSPQGTKFWCQLICLVTSFICCKFKKKCLWNMILYNFFHDLIHVYSPGQGQTAPRGQSFNVNRKALSLYLFAAGERGGSVVECRTPEREVRGSRPTTAVMCPWARHFTPRKYWFITQEAMAPSRHDWKNCWLGR